MKRPIARLPAWLLCAGLFALAELMSGLLVGQFTLRGRAEPTLFLAFRPWLLLGLVLALAHRSTGLRLGAYAMALLVASLSESMLAWQLGAPFPLAGLARAVAAGAMIVLVLDGLVRLIRRAWPAQRFLLPAAVCLAMLALPGPVRLFETIALPPVAEEPPGAKVALLTGLPVIWGEQGPSGALRGDSRPAEAYAMLARFFDVRPIDAVTADAIGPREVLVIAQPRHPTPYDLVMFDAVVRRGGRALLLLDPALHWPSALPLGDPRRPPPADPLAPLLAHWGLSLVPPSGEAEPVDHSLDVAGRPYRVRTLGPGRLTAAGGMCRILDRGLVADCAFGEGRAVIVADADLLQDALWVGSGLFGASREGRLADNGLYIAAWVADLAGQRDFAPTEAVQWADPTKSHGTALLIALLPPLLCLICAVLAARRRQPARRERRHR